MSAFYFARCHGERGNVIYELTKDKNVLNRRSELKFQQPNHIRSNGDEISSELSKKFIKLAHEIYDGDSYEEEKIAFRGSVGNFFAKKYVST